MRGSGGREERGEGEEGGEGRCGVAWRGVAWCGVAWCGVAWCGVVRHGVVRSETAAATALQPSQPPTNPPGYPTLNLPLHPYTPTTHLVVELFENLPLVEDMILQTVLNDRALGLLLLRVAFTRPLVFTQPHLVR